MKLLRVRRINIFKIHIKHDNKSCFSWHVQLNSIPLHIKLTFTFFNKIDIKPAVLHYRISFGPLFINWMLPPVVNLFFSLQNHWIYHSQTIFTVQGRKPTSTFRSSKSFSWIAFKEILVWNPRRLSWAAILKIWENTARV